MKPEISAYAPIRLREQPQYLFARAEARDGAITAEGTIASDLHARIQETLIKPSMQMALETCYSEKFDDSAIATAIAKFLSYSDWVPLIGQYERCGKQIFDLHDSLTEMLGHTDLGECTLEDLHLPYSCFYIHFGKLLDVKHVFDSAEGTYAYMDGVFVALSPWDEEGNCRIKMGLSTVHEDGTGVMYPGLFIDLLPEERKMPVLLGIESALARRHKAHQADADSTETYMAIMRRAQDDDEDAAETLRKAASLVINALFYIESLRENLPSAGPGRDTPPSLMAKWSTANPRQRQKQRSALLADGYALVHLVGGEIEAQSTTATTGASRKVHWRRGHWRQQPYGEHKLLRRRTWIKPVLVGAADAATVETPGHIYLAPGSDRPH
jgi:hypothetical protein